MPEVIEGNLDAKGLRFALIVSRFNDFVSRRLMDGAMDAIHRCGGRDDDITVLRVPGSFEIPAVARKSALSGRHDAVVCLGAVIRGSTPHFDYVAAEVSKGIAAVALEAGVPVTFGVITADNLEQAIDRAGAKSGNKGFDAAMAAIEMANLYKSMHR
jgi:6,7-dimethyl-8-ribityllumazine synthase